MTSETTLPTCYRHPDRETRLGCSNCARPVCVDCVRTAAVGQRCLECAAPAESQRVLDMDDIQRKANRPTPVTTVILLVSAAVFLFRALSPEASNTVSALGAQLNFLVEQGQWWRALTAAFIHASLYTAEGVFEITPVTHILFNMYALYAFGPPLERDVGARSFAALYVASALSGGALFYVLDPAGQAVGASGAIFGLFGAWLAISYRLRHTAAGRANLNHFLVLLAVNASIGFVPGFNIAWEAHLGGLIAGVVIALVWGTRAAQRQPLVRVGAAVAVGVIALGLLAL